jgi:hypothetical protein
MLVFLLAQVDVLPSTADPAALAVWLSAGFVPIISGVVAVAIKTGMPRRFDAFMALVLGVGAGVSISFGTELDLFTGLIQGTVGGLAATTLYTVASSTRTNGN